jgi:hypothetical protein
METIRYCLHQNELITRTQIKILYKQQTFHLQNYTQTNLGLRNTTLGNRIHIQHRNTRTFPVEGSVYDNGHTMICTYTVIWKDLQIPTVKHEISRYSYHYSKRLSVHSNELILNLQEPPETRQLHKNLPIDVPTRFSM